MLGETTSVVGLTGSPSMIGLPNRPRNTRRTSRDAASSRPIRREV